MKALILAAGRGKRLNEITEPLNKCMLRFHEKYLIQYSLESAILSRVDEIIMVVGYQAESIINTFGTSFNSTRIKYVIQRDLKGLVDAIENAKKELEGDDFILLLADEILINPHTFEMIKAFKDDDLFVMCGVTAVEEVDEIKKTYSVIFNPLDNRIYRLVEKPRKTINNIMGTGVCIFKNQIFDYIPHTPINQSRHEKELPDLIQCAIDDGNPVKLYFISSNYVNINTFDDIKIAEKILERNIQNWKNLVTA
jgi:dTDP-glucose pyrophosphorylase